MPWVVQVDNLGQAQPVAPATPTIARPIRRSPSPRALHRAGPLDPADAIIVRQNWLRAYDFTTEAARWRSTTMPANDPFTKVGSSRSRSRVSSVIRASPSSFRVAWIERRYQDGSLASTERWSAIPPSPCSRRATPTLRKNPLGIYVNAINWSKELGQ